MVQRHSSSAEQKADLGKVRHKPRQGDLLTGEFSVKPPKRGKGDHVVLKDGAGRKPIGMAYFPGTGPERTYCRECIHCQDLPVWRNGRYESEASSREDGPRRVERESCKLAATLFDHVVQRGGIGNNRSCKYFEGRGHEEPVRRGE